MTPLDGAAEDLESLETTFSRLVYRTHFLIELTMPDSAVARLTNIFRQSSSYYEANHWLEQFVRRSPLVYARWLVGVAGDVYEKGRLWPHVADILGRSDATRVGQLLGPLFINVLERYDRLTFPGHRYVANILGHSAVPESILPELIAMVDGERQRLARQATAIVLWDRLQASPALSYKSKPLQRFFGAGDAVGAPYVQQIRRFLENPTVEDVSPSVHRAYWAYKTGKTKAPTTTSARGTGPAVFTALSDSPLVVRIPASAMSRDQKWSWSVLADGVELLPEAYRRAPSPSCDVNVPAPCNELEVRRTGQTVLHYVAPCPGVWLFDDSESIVTETWVRPGSYTAILPRNWRVAGGRIVLEEAPWLDDWRPWMLVALELAAGEVFTITDEHGRIRLQVPVVEPLRRVAPPGDPQKVQVGQRLQLRYEGNVSALGDAEYTLAVTPPTGPSWQRTTTFRNGGPYSLILDDWGSHVGSYQVSLHGPLQFRDTLRILASPTHHVTVPPALSWPNPRGVHRSGEVTLTTDPGVSVAGWAQVGDTNAFRSWLCRQQHSLDAHLTVNDVTFTEAIFARNIWWEWSGLNHQRPIANASLHCTLHELRANRTRLALWQQEPWRTDLRLTDCRHQVIWQQTATATAEAGFGYSDWADAIANTDGEDFHLMALPVAEHPVGAFWLAWIRRPVFENLRVDPDRRVLVWEGPDPGRCHVSVMSVRAGDEQRSSALLEPTRAGVSWELPFPTSRPPFVLACVRIHSHRHDITHTIPVMIPPPMVRGARLSGDSLHALGQFFQATQVRRADEAVWRRYHGWVVARGAPPPADDIRMWTAGFSMLPESGKTDAFRTTIAAAVRTCPQDWLAAALQQPMPDSALVELGYPQWQLGALPWKTARATLGYLKVLAQCAPVHAWLLITGTESFDPGADPTWLRVLFGERDAPSSVDLLNHLSTAGGSDRSAVMRYLEDCDSHGVGEPPAAIHQPVFLPTRCAIDPAQQQWLHDSFLHLSSPQGFLRQAERLWMDGEMSHAVIMWITCLQRAYAYEIWDASSADVIRLYTQAVRQYHEAPAAYRQALLRADLLVGLEHTIRINQGK